MTNEKLSKMTFEELSELISRKATELHGLLEDINNETDFPAYGMINVSVENEFQEVGTHTAAIGRTSDICLALHSSEGLAHIIKLTNVINDHEEKGANQ